MDTHPKMWLRDVHRADYHHIAVLCQVSAVTILILSGVGLIGVCQNEMLLTFATFLLSVKHSKVYILLIFRVSKENFTY